MTSLKTKNIWFLAAFLFLSIVPTLAEVVNTVQDCKQFLLQGTPPKIPNVLVNGNIQNQNRYKVICQTFNGVPRYLTVYDINNKIPVFSAYEYRGRGPKRRDAPWMIEPQLENGATPKDMMKEEKDKTYTKQAVNADYDRNRRGFQKGHLFPVNHASTLDDQISTFTLTNAVPQVGRFNRGRWRTIEQRIRNTMNQHITNQIRCFVVVGAIPSDNNIPNNKLNNRVNIPSVMWSAFYCTDQTSRAYWGSNDADSPLHTVSLQYLRNSQWGIDAFPRAP